MRITHLAMLVIVGTLFMSVQAFAQNGAGDGTCDPVNDQVRDCIQQMTQQYDACKDQIRQKLQTCLQDIDPPLQDGDMVQARLQARQCLEEITEQCDQLRLKIRTQTQDCIRQQLQAPACDPADCDRLIMQSRIRQRQLSRLKINANQQIGMAVDCLYLQAGE